MQRRIGPKNFQNFAYELWGSPLNQIQVAKFAQQVQVLNFRIPSVPIGYWTLFRTSAKFYSIHLGLPPGHGKAENMAPEVVTSPRKMAVKTNGCVITRGLQGPKSSLFTVHSAPEASVRFLCDPSRNSNGIRTFGVKATRKLKIQKNLQREPNFSTINTKI